MQLIIIIIIIFIIIIIIITCFLNDWPCLRSTDRTTDQRKHIYFAHSFYYNYTVNSYVKLWIISIRNIAIWTILYEL